jgi:alkylation response protein AidB-like acyl-CoA dehydrogenase
MEFSFTPEQERLREEVRTFIKEYPPENFSCQIEDEGYGFGGWSEDYSKLLGPKKWLSYPWPKQYGGLDGSLMDWFVIKEELAYNRAPTFATFFNDSVGTSILRHGTPDQKTKFLPNMASGEMFFCTALTEPNAGSDLLSMQAKAEKRGKYYVINGQKTWNTGAHLADWTMAIVRTDSSAEKHKGLTSLLVDLKTPGITIRPILDITNSISFSEIFFEDVLVPEENILGDENKGIVLILESLEGDRFWGRCVRAAGTQRTFDEVVSFVKQRGLNRLPYINNALAEISVELQACKMITYWIIWLLDQGKTLTYEACILKTFADELGHRFLCKAMEILKSESSLNLSNEETRLRQRLVREYLFSFGTLIAGGTPEIQRNTIAVRGLNLPRG